MSAGRALAAAAAAEDAAPHSVDPLSDLLFTMVAILLLVLMMLLPGLVLSGTASNRAQQAQPLARQTFEFDGRGVDPFLATQRGVLQAGIGGVVPLDAITTDGRLTEQLNRLKADGRRIILLVSPDGLEASFEFEALAALRGVDDIWQVRLGQDCRAGDGRAPIAECLDTTRGRPR